MTARGKLTPEILASQANIFSFFVQNLINKVNTALPVKVISVDSTSGYVDVQPLILDRDAFDNAMQSPIIYKVPYVRIQGGKAALIIDPVPGDLGIAIFAQKDISNLSDTPKKALSYRKFDLADAMYIGGILNEDPEVYVEVTPEGEINIEAPTKVTINTAMAQVECDTLTANITQTASINALASLAVTSPAINLSGITTITGATTIAGAFTVQGAITAEEAIIDDKPYTLHTHGGVTTGGGNTAKPN